MTDWAASLTYYGLLSLFPALIALVSLLGIFADPEETTSPTCPRSSRRSDPRPPPTPSRARSSRSPPTASAAGVIFFVGLGVALCSASGYVGAFSRASNVIYEIREGRPFWKLRPFQVLVTLVMVLLVALLALGAGPDGPGRRRGRRAARDRRHGGGRLEHRQVAGDAPGRPR